MGSRVDDIYMVMEYVQHDLKQLSESMKQPFSVAEVGADCLISIQSRWPLAWSCHM